MAKRIFTTQNQNWTATANNTAIAAAQTYMGMQGGNATQVCDVLEIMISGTAAASAVGSFYFGAVQTVPSGALSIGAAGTDGPMHGSATALATAFVPFNTAATTQPTTPTFGTKPVLELGVNTFGGILRWNAAPTQQVTIVGNAATAPNGSYVLWNSNVGGTTTTANAHIMYEPY